MKRILYILLFVVISSSFCTAQSRKDLEKKRRSLSSQISKTSQLLKKTSSSKKATLHKLGALKKQIDSREGLILLVAENVDSLNSMIDRKILVVEALETDLGKLKGNYKKLIRRLYRYKLSKNILSFVLSSKSFNEAYHRWIYLQHLQDYRTTQANFIQKTQDDLARRVNDLEAKKAEKDILLQQELEQKQLLDQELKHKDQLVSELKTKESRLRSDLKRKTRYRKQLNKKIENTILQQIAAAKSAAREYKKAQAAAAAKKASPKTNPILKSVKPNTKAGKSFAQQKGRLMSPIYHGVVISRFGKHKHPVFKDVIVNNNGIDIKGQYNSVVRNVYEGTVVSIFTIPGLNNAVMVKHGDYYTTYSNVAKVYVKKGDRLRTGGQIGTIGRDTNAGGHFMHFELWRNKTKENPSAWIKK